MQNNSTYPRHSDEIQQIITKIPSWIVRWGIALFGLILVFILSISAIVRYPDVIKLPVKLQVTKSNEVIGIINLSQQDFTKVKAGQHAGVMLTIYPVNEYGMLSGSVNHISEEPDTHGAFTVLLKLDPASMKKNIKIKNWMTGEAEIITQDITVLQRITKNIVKL